MFFKLNLKDYLMTEDTGSPKLQSTDDSHWEEHEKLEYDFAVNH